MSEPKLTEAQYAAIDGWLRLNHGPDQIAEDVARMIAAAEEAARAKGIAEGLADPLAPCVHGGLMAQAWDEGYSAAASALAPKEANPYREATP